MPSIPYAFYYMVSSMVYMTPVVLSLFLYSAVFRLFRLNPGLKKLALLFLSCILIVAIIGCNELFMLLLLTLNSTMFVYRYLKRKGQLTENIIILFATFCGVFLMTTAPGVKGHFRFNPIDADSAFFFHELYRTAFNSIMMMKDWIFFGHVLWVSSIIFIPVAIYMAKTNQRVRNNWGLPPLPGLR